MALVLTGGSAQVAAAETWTTSLAAYEAGRQAFLRADFTEAARAFARAYELDPDPRLAGNLGEAYRRLGQCERALEHFDIYLKATKEGPGRAGVVRRADLLRAQCGTKLAAPSPATPPAPSPPPIIIHSEEAAAAAKKDLLEQPQPWLFALEAGVSVGRWATARSLSPALRLSGAHRWGFEGPWAFGLDLGLQWSTFAYGSNGLIPEPYERRAQLLEAVAGAHLLFTLLDGFDLRVDLGGGLTAFSGFDAANELALDGRAANPGVLPTFRAALGAEIGLPLDALLLRLTPAALTYTPTAEGAVGPNLSLVASVGLALRLD